MTRPRDLEAVLGEIIAHHEQHGVLPPIDEIARQHPDLEIDLVAMAYRYLAISSSLDTGAIATAMHIPPARVTATVNRKGTEPLPTIEGFRTIERIGGGGMGEVYKLHDEKLDRIVAAKIIRRYPGTRVPGLHQQADPGLHRAGDFFREARALALFSDPRIVQIHEYRTDTDPVVIIMEFVDGFELGRLGPSLEMPRRAKVMRDVCEAVHHAHSLGIQHRDLKPSNIMLDGALQPKILDFGLSDSDPARGHLRGTVHYIAPEQLDPRMPIDARTDVYALGVILYELLTGTTPFHGTSEEVLESVRTGHPRLPREIDVGVPEPLQAIALKAMERRPADRYPSAREMSRDLTRYLDGRPVLARPTEYATTLVTRVKPHLDQIGEWLRLKLIYPHEAVRLRAAYGALDAREDDWILASRELSYSQIALYLGAFFLFAGSLFYFVAHRLEEAITGLTGPILVLGLPFVGLNVAGRALYRREHQAVAVASFLGGLSLLPLFLLIWFHETGFWVATEGDTRQLFTDGWVSNRQLQVTVGIACAWATWLALRTRTSALSTVATLLLFAFALAILADFGLRTWFDEGRYDLIGLRLTPLVLAYSIAGLLLERSGRIWFAKPAYVAAGLTLVASLDLWALDGKLLHYLGITMRMLQPADVENPVLLDQLAGLTLNGVLIYGASAALERRGTPTMGLAAQVLFTLAPFSILEPLAYLTSTAIYDKRFDWLYLALAIGIAVLSQRRQRKSFYYAGVVNSGLALYLIAVRNEWFDRPGWAITIVSVGLAALGVGFWLEARRRKKVGDGS